MKTPNSNSPAILQSGLFVALCSALSISAWSLFWVGRHYGLPWPVAVLVSAGFDGAALAAAGYALGFVQRGLKSWAPQLLVVFEALASMFLNAQHAALQHDPHAAALLYAVPPLTVVALFELHLRMSTASKPAPRPAKPKPTVLKEKREEPRGEKQEVVKNEKKEAVAETEKKTSAKDARSWAVAQGLEVPSRGPVSKEVLKQYAAASNGHGHV